MSCDGCDGLTLTVDGGSGLAVWDVGYSGGVGEERLREIVREEVLKVLGELGTCVPGEIRL